MGDISELAEEISAHMRGQKPASARQSRGTLRRLYVAHVLQCLSTTMREQAAPGLVYSLFQNDMVASATFLSSYDSASGLVAFALSPSFGSLSDWIGRKPFLLLWPVASTLLCGLVASRPLRWLMFLQMSLLGALVNAFETNVRSVIPDLVSGDALVSAYANIGACQGVAFFLGSGLTGLLSGVDPRLSMLAAALASTLSGLVLATVPETLRGPRAPFRLRSANPLGFLALLSGGSEYNRKTGGAIRRLACVFTLQKTVWPGLNEQIHVYSTGRLNWQPANFARYMTLVGVGHVLGNKLTGPTLRIFGPRLHTHIANPLFAGMFASIGSAHVGFGTRQVHAGQVLGWLAVPHAVCETAISSRETLTHFLNLLTDDPSHKNFQRFADADAAGLGQGKLQGDIGNFIALIKIFVPMVYGRAMAWGSANNVPGAAIYTASIWWLASSLLFCLVRPSDIRAVAARTSE